MADTIDNLSIEITASAENLARVLNSLASGCDKLRGASSRASGGLRNMATAAKDAGTATAKAGQQAQKTSEDIAKAGNSAKNAGDSAKKGASGINVFWNALRQAGGVGLKAMKGALIDLPMYFGQRLTSKIGQSVKSLGQFFNSIKRIAMYRAIRSALKLITQGFQQGMQNLYSWSNAAGTEFARSMDTIKTASQYANNSLAALASPLINSVSPAIDFIVDKFVDMFNIINQIIARLTGQTSYTAAKKVAAQWGGASKSASGSARKAADEIKRTLLAFDEINKLNDNNESAGGGGGGGGGGGASGAGMFEQRQIESWISDMVDSGDFTVLGQSIADKINNALASINWESIRAKAVGVVDSITSLINGFIGEIDPAILGRSLAEAINTAATTIDRFWSGVKWEEAGKKLRKAIVEFFQSVDVEAAANALTGQFKSLVTLIANAIPSSKEEWNVIAYKISLFIQRAIYNIPFDGIGDIIGNLLLGAIKTMTMLADNGTLTNIATGIKTTIEEACKKITKEDIQNLVTSVLKDVLTAVGVLLTFDVKLGDLEINPIIATVFAVGAWKSITSLLKNVFGSGAGFSGGLFVAGLAISISPIVEGITALVNNTSGNVEVTKDAVISIVSGAFRAAGVGLAYAGIKTGNAHLGAAGIALFALSFAIKPICEEVTNFVNNVKNGTITGNDVASLIATGFMTAGLIAAAFDPATGLVLLAIGAIIKLIISDIIPEMPENLKWGPLGELLFGGNTSNEPGTVGYTDYFGLQLINPIQPMPLPEIPASEVASNFQKDWDSLDPSKKKVNLISNLTRKGGNWYNGVSEWVKKNGFNLAIWFVSNLTRKGGNWVGGVTKWLKDNGYNLAASLITNLTRKGGNWSGGLGKWIKKNGFNMTTAITTILQKGWGKKTPLKALGIDRLIAPILAKFEISPKDSTIKVKSGGGGQVWRLTTKAKGGIFSAGGWADIPQFAGGTTNVRTGSLFWAGENGNSEIVGNVGGRTEVLNRSQIASAIYSSVRAAMAPAAAHFAAAAQYMANTDTDSDDGSMMDMIQRAVENALSRSNDLDRQRNEYLRQINDKDFTTEYSTSAINKAQTRMNRRAGVTIVPVGT